MTLLAAHILVFLRGVHERVSIVPTGPVGKVGFAPVTETKTLAQCIILSAFALAYGPIRGARLKLFLDSEGLALCPEAPATVKAKWGHPGHRECCCPGARLSKRLDAVVWPESSRPGGGLTSAFLKPSPSELLPSSTGVGEPP